MFGLPSLNVYGLATRGPAIVKEPQCHFNRKMKFSSSSSSLNSIGGVSERKSTFCVYTEPEFLREKIDMTSAALRQRLETAEVALDLQTIRCTQVVTECALKLQKKEDQLRRERDLRNEQLAIVDEALLMFETRLKNDQLKIKQLLVQKDKVIDHQRSEILRLRNVDNTGTVDKTTNGAQYCRNCQQMFELQNSFVNTKTQVKNEFAFRTPYDADSKSNKDSSSSEEYSPKSDQDSVKGFYRKNKSVYSSKNNFGSIRRSKKYGSNRKVNSNELNKSSAFVLTSSSDDNDDGLRKDANVESQQTTTRTKNLVQSNYEQNVSGVVNKDNNSESIRRRTTSFSNWMNTLHGIQPKTNEEHFETIENHNNNNTEIEQDRPNPKIDADKSVRFQTKKLVENTTNFEDEDNESKIDENWYASGSEGDEENATEIYMENPVLECVNQILLQNSMETSSHSDSTSPKFSPKRSRFSPQNSVLSQDNVQIPKSIITNSSKYPGDNVPKSPKVVKFNLNSNASEKGSDRSYETPVECFNYEVQSIYSNDYEPIVVNSHMAIKPYHKTNSFVEKIVQNIENAEVDSHYYVDMDSKTPQNDEKTRKPAKIPPALPPKPPNLISKYKLHQKHHDHRKNADFVAKIQKTEVPNIIEPDYCSISEINEQVVKKPATKYRHVDKQRPKYVRPEVIETLADVHNVDNAAVTKLPKNNNNKVESNVKFVGSKIPKLPQVSEILIPKEDKFEKLFGQDNYIKNNSELLKLKKKNEEIKQSSIQIGNSVSNILTEINRKQTPEKQQLVKIIEQNCENPELVGTNFENYDLSQTFEEFKLDDCEIQNMDAEEYLINENQDFVFHESDENEDGFDNPSETVATLEVITSTGNLKSKFLQSQLSEDEIEASSISGPMETVPENNSDQSQQSNDETRQSRIDRNYEFFLESSGLSSKDILTPSRLLSNHKNMLKPKDVKLRSKVRTSIDTTKPGTTVRYWSEPFL